MSTLTASAGNIQQTKAILASYMIELERCILNAQWEILSDILDKRQHYFEMLFADPELANTAEFSALIKQVFEEDNTMINKIMAQKAVIEQERLGLMRSRQAAKAYE
ncbi:MAG: flagellar protein FliT [Methylococcaceae bacterium]|nr:flagellar protein FliT [Methylococcaceae bacterium]